MSCAGHLRESLNKAEQAQAVIDKKKVAVFIYNVTLQEAAEIAKFVKELRKKRA